VAKALASWSGGELIRLQCYEGLDAAQAVYEWDHARQLLHLRAAEAAGTAAGQATDDLEGELYTERFLVRRALLRAIAPTNGAGPPVLLIDEIDRADDEFEAFLLEVLAEYAITVPELGTFRADVPPIVVITSNRTRDVHDALKRRCLYHWVEHPDFDREVAIVRLRAPGVAERLAKQVAAAVEGLRAEGLYKPPGVAETIDWAEALATLGRATLDEASVQATLGTVLKYREDQERVRAKGVGALVQAAVLRGM
jgi:MoxR-like ATPase